MFCMVIGNCIRNVQSRIMRPVYKFNFHESEIHFLKSMVHTDFIYRIDLEPMTTTYNTDSIVMNECEQLSVLEKFLTTVSSLYCFA